MLQDREENAADASRITYFTVDKGNVRTYMCYSIYLGHHINADNM